jgi:hypothetical protein
MTGYKSKRAAAQDKVTDIDGHVVRDARKPRKLPQRPWVGLTDKEVDQFHNWKDCTWSTNELVRHVEATLRSKNT